MAKFEIADEITSENEGGYTDNPNDSGNWTSGKVGVGQLIGTKYGISAPVLSSTLKRVATLFDMQSLSHEAAKSIRKKLYWDKVKGDEIKSQEMANSIYDSAINMGVGTAIKLAQRAASIDETGIMDQKTLKALNG